VEYLNLQAAIVNLRGGDSNMLGQELHFYSLDPAVYEQHLKKYGFEILLKESDQDQHLVWIAKKND